MAAAYYDFFRKILLQPDGITLEADSVEDTLTITSGNGVAFNPNASTDSFTIDVNYQLYVPLGTTSIRLNDVNSNTSDITISAGSNIVVARNSNNELVITATVGGTSKALAGITQASPGVLTTTLAHGFTDGIAVTITDVGGMTQVNGNEYYMDILTSNTFALYTDSNLSVPLDTTGFGAYTSGGIATAEYAAPQALNQLNDVSLVDLPVSGDFLQYNGTYWGKGTDINGTLTGDVKASDASVMVDSSAKTFTGDLTGAVQTASLRTSEITIALGNVAGQTTQGERAIAIGNYAGQTTQGTRAIAIGNYAGKDNQGTYATAIGNYAGNDNQGTYATALGDQAGQTSQGIFSVALGYVAGETTQDIYATALGSFSGRYRQGARAASLGVMSGHQDQGSFAVALGAYAGTYDQSQRATAIGSNAGYYYQGQNATAVGYKAGRGIIEFATYVSGGVGSTTLVVDDTSDIVAGMKLINTGGYTSGQTVVSVDSSTSLTISAVADGAPSSTIQFSSGGQGLSAVAIGDSAGETTQGINATAIGPYAGKDNQGASAVAIGNHAGRNNQAANSIVINASNLLLDNTQANSFVVKPIRGADNTNYLKYNTTTGEVTYVADVAGVFTGDLTGSVFADDSTVLVDGVAGKIVGEVTGNVNTTSLIATSIKVGGGNPTVDYDVGGEGTTNVSDSIAYTQFINGSAKTAQSFLDSKSIEPNWTAITGTDYSHTKAQLRFLRGNPTDALKAIVSNPISGYGDTIILGNVDDDGTSVELRSGLGITGSKVNLLARGDDTRILIQNESADAPGDILINNISPNANSKLELVMGTNASGVTAITLKPTGIEVWGPIEMLNHPITGNLTGNVTGTLDGDVTGSVFGDDSTVIVDAVNNSVIVNGVEMTGPGEFNNMIKIEGALQVMGGGGAVNSQAEGYYSKFEKGLGVDGDVYLNRKTNVKAVHQTMPTLVSPTGTVDLEISGGVAPSTTWYIYQPAVGCVTNLTNLELFNGYQVVVTLQIYQGSTPVLPAIQIAGVPFTTIRWQYGVVPTPAPGWNVIQYQMMMTGSTMFVTGQLGVYSN